VTYTACIDIQTLRNIFYFVVTGYITRIKQCIDGKLIIGTSLMIIELISCVNMMVDYWCALTKLKTVLGCSMVFLHFIFGYAEM